MILKWLSNFFTNLFRNNKVFMQHLVQAEIESLFAHNPPDVIRMRVVEWLSKTPLGKQALGPIAIAQVLMLIDPALSRNSTDAAKQAFTQWAFGRLGLK